MSRAFPFLALAVCAAAASHAIAGQAPADPPSPVEQAVVEHRCNANRSVAVASTEQYQTCLSAQLLALRADFGVDLKQVSPAERKTLDSVCSRVRSAEGRDAYVACLSNQLWALHNRRTGGAAPASPPVASAAAVAAAPTLETPAVTTPAPTAGSSVGLWIGLGLGAVALVAGAGVVALRGRRRPSICRSCGVSFSEPGDMCPACRHAAAEAHRRAAAERDQRDRPDVDEQRRRVEREEALQRQRAIEQEHARRELEARAREQEQARVLEEQRRRDEERREREQYGAQAAAAFDPHAVLDVMPGATPDELRFAYEQAKAKYDAAVVSHLSEEVQAHYRAKAEAVERAYRMLTGASGSI